MVEPGVRPRGSLKMSGTTSLYPGTTSELLYPGTTSLLLVKLFQVVSIVVSALSGLSSLAILACGSHIIATWKSVAVHLACGSHIIATWKSVTTVDRLAHQIHWIVLYPDTGS